MTANSRGCARIHARCPEGSMPGAGLAIRYMPLIIDDQPRMVAHEIPMTTITAPQGRRCDDPEVRRKSRSAKRGKGAADGFVSPMSAPSSAKVITVRRPRVVWVYTLSLSTAPQKAAASAYVNASAEKEACSNRNIGHRATMTKVS